MLADEDVEEGVSDLIRLDTMTEETVLRNLLARYQRKEIYVRYRSVLLAKESLLLNYHPADIHWFHIDKRKSVSTFANLWTRRCKGIQQHAFGR